MPARQASNAFTVALALVSDQCLMATSRTILSTRMTLIEQMNADGTDEPLSNEIDFTALAQINAEYLIAID